MTNKDKFLKLVSGEDSQTIADIRKRIANKAMLRESQKIALKVLMKLDDLGWSQKKLAQEIGVLPQQITKIVSGKENLTIETQIKLQDALDIPILASYYEDKSHVPDTLIFNIPRRIESVITPDSDSSDWQQETKVIKMEPKNYSEAFAIQ